MLPRGRARERHLDLPIAAGGNAGGRLEVERVTSSDAAKNLRETAVFAEIRKDIATRVLGKAEDIRG